MVSILWKRLKGIDHFYLISFKKFKMKATKIVTHNYFQL